MAERGTTFAHTNPLESGVQDLVSRLSGVVGSRAVSAPDGSIGELHILADSTRHPKNLARDIQSALLAGLGLSIDHRVISVAQLRASLPKGPQDLRIRLKSVCLHIQDRTVTAQVELLFGEEEFSGSQSGSLAKGERIRIVAGAVLNAINESLGAEHLFVLADSKAFTFADTPCVCVAVDCLADGRQERLMGSAFQKTDADMAAVNAVLDAINRRFSQMSR